MQRLSSFIFIFCLSRNSSAHLHFKNGKSNTAAFAFKLPSFEFSNPFGSLQPSTSGDIELEEKLIATISDYGRLNNVDEISTLVAQLEQSQKSVTQPSISPKVYGRWRLLHTTNAETSSPIQRKAVDASKYQIYQDIVVRKKENNDAAGDGENESGIGQEELIVSQVVKFGENFQLVVDALASTSVYPIAELMERQRTGKILGFLNVLGVSKIGEEAKPDPSRPDSRIAFVFDEGNFQLFDFFGKDWTIPYPVPFRSPLFRDAVKGWIDITYLSDKIRIAKGNKGTTFVLLKEDLE